MKIIKKKIKDLKEAPYNPRVISKEELESLKKSIKKFGYVEPIIINKRTGFVVGGNQRLKVLKELGYDEVDIVEVDLTDEEEKTLNLALNKISGDWDEEKLIDILNDIKEQEGDLLEYTGFDEDEVYKYLNIDEKNIMEDFDFKKENKEIIFKEVLYFNKEEKEMWDLFVKETKSNQEKYILKFIKGFLINKGLLK